MEQIEFSFKFSEVEPGVGEVVILAKKTSRNANSNLQSQETIETPIQFLDVPQQGAHFINHQCPDQSQPQTEPQLQVEHQQQRQQRRLHQPGKEERGEKIPDYQKQHTQQANIKYDLTQSNKDPQEQNSQCQQQCE